MFFYCEEGLKFVLKEREKTGHEAKVQTYGLLFQSNKKKDGSNFVNIIFNPFREIRII